MFKKLAILMVAAAGAEAAGSAGGAAAAIPVIVVGATVDYTAKVAGKPDKTYKGLVVTEINKERAKVVDGKKKEHDLALADLTFVSGPEGAAVKPPRIKKEPVPYERGKINELVKADRAAGKTRLYPNKAKYVAGTSTSPDARKTIDVADEVATKLRGVSLDQMYTVLGEYVSAERVAECKAKYAGKNIGMQRMNVGNVIRGAINAKAKAAAAATAKAAADAAKPAADAKTTPAAGTKPAAGKAAGGKAAAPAAGASA